MPTANELASITWKLALAFALITLSLTGLHIGQQVQTSLLAIQQDIHQTTGQVQKSTVAMQKNANDVSSMLNANLIHTDLILARTEDVSRKEEMFWDRFSMKSLETLDHANFFLAGLDDTTKGANIILAKTANHANASLDSLTADAHHTLVDSDVALVSVNKEIHSLNVATDNLNAVVTGPEITGTLKHVNESTAAIAKSAEHSEQIFNDVRVKVDTVTHPTKKQKFLNMLQDFIGTSAHLSEIWYYLR